MKDRVDVWQVLMNIPVLWGMKNPADPAHNIDGSGVDIVEIDSGVITSQIDLAGRTINGQNLLTHGPITDPDINSHGTHVAGILSAVSGNKLGVVGGAPGANLTVYGVNKGTGKELDEALIVEAVNDAIAIRKTSGRPMVMNMSFGGTGLTQALADAVKNAIAADIMIFASAGNSGDALCTQPLEYPAGLPGVHAVGGLNNDLTRNKSSQCGAELMGFWTATTTTKAGDVAFADVLTPAGDEVFGSSFSASNADSFTGTVRDVGTGLSASDWDNCSAGCIGLIHGVKGADYTQPSVIPDLMAAAGATGGIFVGASMADYGPIWSQNNPYVFVVNYSSFDAEHLNALVGQTVTLRNGTCDFGGQGGTSNSAPQVAAVAALLWSTAPTLPSSTIGAALDFGARHLGKTPAYTKDPENGWGKVDAQASYNYLHPPARHRAAQH